MPVRLVMTDICKTYGPSVALENASFELQVGEVHALLGENGAGKSTLMRILCGAETPDSGHVELSGSNYRPSNPATARRAGIVMVHQELTLAPDLDVESNILLGQERSRFGFLNRDQNRDAVTKVLQQLAHPEIKSHSKVSDLSPAAKQLVEIARALISDVKVLILDEPTSSLSQEDVRHLFTLIRKLKERGVSIIYISHFLEEIESIADRFTVLRDGKTVGSGVISQIDRSRLIEMMVGRKVEEQYPRIHHVRGTTILKLEHLLGAITTGEASFELHRGEIFGIAGLIGSGRTELMRTIFGLEAIKSGQIEFKTYSGFSKPRRRVEQGMGLLSEDRNREGLALDQSLADNLTYSWLKPYRKLGLLSVAKRDAAADALLIKLNTRFHSVDQNASDLSGGNQQKVAIARLLHQQADLLLLDEPTRGIDIASRSEIYRLIGELAAQGKSILIVSSYLPELFGICDRLAVMTPSGLSDFQPLDYWTPEFVLEMATQNQNFSSQTK